MAASEQTVMLRRLRALYRRHARAVDKVGECERERTALYLEARALDPPVTYAQIAAVFQITEAAVMQKVSRHYKRVGSEKPKPKRRPS